MAETYALISTRIRSEGGDWFLYEKQGFDPMIMFHKHGHHGSDVRRCHINAGWRITPLTIYNVNDEDIDRGR